MSESKSASVVFTNGSLLAKNAQATAEEARELANGAQKTADGKNSVYRGSDPATVPTAGLKEGDIYFTDNALYTWNGSSWEKTVSDTTGEEIHAKVEAAMQESQKAVADLKTDVEAKVKDLDDEIAKTGNALNFYKEQYYQSTSYTELEGGSWSDDVPVKTEGKYVWSRYVTANIGDSTNYQYSDPVCISGLDGEPGPTGATGPKGDTGSTGFFIGTTPPPNPTTGTVWATNDSSGNMVSAKTWNGSTWTSTAFTQDLVAGNITADKIVGGTLDVNKITIANAQNIPVTSTVSLGDKLSSIEQDANSLNDYVRGSKGSKILESIMSMDPNNSTIAQVVNGQVVAAINTSSDGSVKIDGKNLYISASTKIDDAVIKSAMIDSIDASKITTGTLDASHIKVINLDANSITTGRLSGRNVELDGNTTVTGRLDLMQKNTNWVSQSTNYHNNWNWNNAHIYFDNYLQLLGENCNVHYTNTDTTLNGGKTFYSITTLTPGYLKFTTYQNKVNTTDESFDGQITRSYLDSGRLETPEVYTDKFVITGHHIRVRDNQYLLVTNKAGTNFDNNGSIVFQVWGGVTLGQNTIAVPTNDMYFQRGNADNILEINYSDASKVTLHAQNLVSQVANTVSSRLSIKTDITKVTYDRALAAVEGTEMYDYRYVSDDSGQHYVSGIIDDVNADPQYHMDGMLINKERTARIDANLLGYHQVVIQKLLERVAALEEKAK